MTSIIIVIIHIHTLFHLDNRQIELNRIIFIQKIVSNTQYTTNSTTKNKKNYRMFSFTATILKIEFKPASKRDD